jgi:hypothetical protein
MKVLATRVQLPLLLGYAVTVHRSQGMTLAKVVFGDGNAAFTKGQGYVAWSRAQDLEGVYMLGNYINTYAIQPPDSAMLFYKEYDAHFERTLQEASARISTECMRQLRNPEPPVTVPDRFARPPLTAEERSECIAELDKVFRK